MRRNTVTEHYRISCLSVSCEVSRSIPVTTRRKNSHLVHFSLRQTLEVSKPLCYECGSIVLFLSCLHLPMKMEPIVSSETSAIRTQTPGNYPKRNKLHWIYSVYTFFQRLRRIGMRKCGSSICFPKSALLPPISLPAQSSSVYR